MQNFGGNMCQGAMSPTSSSMSGSSVRSSNEFNQQQLKTKLVTENAAMDYSMRTLELKMQGKQEELKNLLEEKASNISYLDNLKKQLTLLQDRESSLAIAITRIRDNNIVSEGLESAVIQNLKAIKISNEEQKSKWETMIKEYTATMNSHQEIYSSLPWVKEKKMLAEKVEKKRIFLERLKLQEEENITKQSLFDKIAVDRMKIEIIKLAKLIVERNNERNNSEELDSRQKTLDQEIETIEREKKDIEDDISMRTQEMMRRIVDRSNIKEKISPPETIKELKITPSISSIRDRLGISNKKEFQESKGMLPAPSLRERLSFHNKILSPWSSHNDSNQPPASIQPDLDVEVSSPSAQSDQPDSPQIVDSSSPPPAVDGDSLEFHSEAAAVETRSENEATPVVPEPSQAQRSEPHLAVTLPEVSVTSSCLSRPVPLKAILRPPASLGAKKPVVSSQTILPSIARGLSQTQTNEFSSAPTVVAFTSQPQTTSASQSQTSFTSQFQATDNEAESTPADLSGSAGDLLGHSSQQPFKRPTEVPRPPDTEGHPEPKKSKVDVVMPPPPKAAVTRRPPKCKRVTSASGGSQQPKTPKRVSFVTGSQTNLGGNSQGSNEGPPGINAPIEPVHALKITPTSSQPPVHQETSGQPHIAPMAPSQPAKEDSVQPSPQTVPAAEQPSPSGSDDFPPPFSSPPQPFSGPSAPQGTPGNFDSIFGAIFSTPQTPNDSMGFQFPIGGDAEKQDSNQGQSQSAPAPPGQDFFSFFGTPNTDNSKKSFSDNFFKLF